MLQVHMLGRSLKGFNDFEGTLRHLVARTPAGIAWTSSLAVARQFAGPTGDLASVGAL